jgi:hypothetical protein
MKTLISALLLILAAPAYGQIAFQTFNAHVIAYDPPMVLCSEGGEAQLLVAVSTLAGWQEELYTFRDALTCSQAKLIGEAFLSGKAPVVTIVGEEFINSIGLGIKLPGSVFVQPMVVAKADS